MPINVDFWQKLFSVTKSDERKWQNLEGKEQAKSILEYKVFFVKDFGEILKTSFPDPADESKQIDLRNLITALFFGALDEKSELKDTAILKVDELVNELQKEKYHEFLYHYIDLFPKELRAAIEDKIKIADKQIKTKIEEEQNATYLEFEEQFKRVIKLKENFFRKIEKESSSETQKKSLFFQLGDQLFILSKQFKKLNSQNQAKNFLAVSDLYDEFLDNGYFDLFLQKNELATDKKNSVKSRFYNMLSSMQSQAKESFITLSSYSKISDDKDKKYQHDESHNDFWIYIRHYSDSVEEKMYDRKLHELSLRKHLSAYCKNNRNLQEQCSLAQKLQMASLTEPHHITFTYSEIMIMLNEPKLRQIVYDYRFGLPKCFIDSAIQTENLRKKELTTLLDEYSRDRADSRFNRYVFWSKFDKTQKLNAVSQFTDWLKDNKKTLSEEYLPVLKDRTVWKIISKFPDLLPDELQSENIPLSSSFERKP